MPTYEYKCEWCGRTEEIILSVDECYKTQVCSFCHNVMKKVISLAGIYVFKPQIVDATLTDKDGNDVNQFVRNKSELTDAINKYNDTERASKTGKVAVLE